MARRSILIIGALLATATSQPVWAQSGATCEQIQASASLSIEEQQALGRDAAATVAALRTANDAGAADTLLGCIANGPAALVTAFQEASPPAIGDVAPEDDDNDESDDTPAGGSPA